MMDFDPLAPLAIAARTLLALVFFSAAIGKLRDRDAFHGVVHAYRLLPDVLVAPVAWVIPIMEIGLGLLMPTGLLPLVAGVAATGLLLVFAGAMSANILRGRRRIDCGCFGGRAGQDLGWMLVLRTTCLGLVGLVAAVPVVADPADAVQGLAAGGVLFLLFMAITLLPGYGRRRPRISL